MTLFNKLLETKLFTLEVNKNKERLNFYEALPCIFFVFIDSWIADYSMPVISLFIGVLYLILSFINRKKSILKLNLFSAFSSLLLGVIMLFVSYLITPELKREVSSEINSIESSICNLDISEKGLWKTTYITKDMLTVKLNFIYEGEIAEVRSSPMIFEDRVMLRKECEIYSE